MDARWRCCDGTVSAESVNTVASRPTRTSPTILAVSVVVDVRRYMLASIVEFET
jgi:hypothetical protein